MIAAYLKSIAMYLMRRKQERQLVSELDEHPRVIFSTGYRDVIETF